MDHLEKIYGKKSFDSWVKVRPKNLRHTRVSSDDAAQEVWAVSSFHELVDCVSFLGTMNKSLTLFYRGQIEDQAPVPTLFRDSWKCFGSGQTFNIHSGNRKKYWKKLEKIGRRVCEICDDEDLGVPRRRGFRNTREIQWAVIQHYGLWPTPLIDITSSLRVAAAFAMGLQHGSPSNPRNGFLYVVGMPPATSFITFDIDQHILLVRLQSACPPIAKRPHYQEGYLVGHFPVYSADEKLEEKSNLYHRLVAKFGLRDDGGFWDEDFPIFPETALLPTDDTLLDYFERHFGPTSPKDSLHYKAKKLE
jgi:hypothetical protein